MANLITETPCDTQFSNQFFSQLIVKYALERGGKQKSVCHCMLKKEKLLMESIEWVGAWPAGPFL